MKINSRQRALLDRVKAEINHHGIPVLAQELAEEFKIPVQAVEASLKLGEKLGETAEGNGYWMTFDLITKWRKIASRHGGFSMSRKGFRELFKLSRTVSDSVFGIVLSPDTFAEENAD